MGDDEARREDTVGDVTGPDPRISAFWQAARGRLGFGKLDGIVGSEPLDVVPPPSFSYGQGAEADDAVREILSRQRTSTTTAREDFHDGDDLPVVGGLAIVLDSQGEPRALVRTTGVTTTDLAVEETCELVYPTHGPTPPVD